MAYLCKRYPYQWELSKARVAKMIYLADWRSAIERGHQVTPTQWYFNWYGPYVEDVSIVAKNNPGTFHVMPSTTMVGNRKELITLRSEPVYKTLTQGDMDTIDFVIRATKDKDWDDFIRLVYSTYPCVSQPKGSQLDLVGLAKKYKKVRGMLGRAPQG